MDGQGVNSIVTAAREGSAFRTDIKEFKGPGHAKLAIPVSLAEGEGKGKETFDLVDVPFVVTRPQSLVFHTLTGLVAYILANRDQLKLDECLVHVVDHKTVRLVSKFEDIDAGRSVYAIASFMELTPGGDPPFTFGKFCDPENFNIAVQALFVNDLDREIVLAVSGSIRNSEAQEYTDDGVSQGVATTASISSGKLTKVPNPVSLRPWRTFRELTQPSTPFVFRARGGSPSQAPSLALFEADGGAWKLEAIQAIAGYLKGNLKANREDPDSEPVVSVVA